MSRRNFNEQKDGNRSERAGKPECTGASDRATLRQLYEWSRGQRVRIVLLVVLNALWAACIVGKALLAKNLIDSAVGRNWDGLVRYAWFLGALILGQILFSLSVASLSEYVTSKLRISLQGRILRTLMDTRTSAFRDYHSGDLQNRLFSDVEVVTTGIVDLLPNGSFLLFKLLGAAVSLSILAPKFTLIFLAAGVLMFVLLTVLRKKMKHLHKEMQAAEGWVRGFFQEVLSGMLVVKVFGAEPQMAAVAADKQEDYFRARMKRRTVTIASNAGFRFIFLGGYFIAMLWGVLGIYGGTVTFGTLTAMLQLVNQIQSPFTGFSGLISRYYSILASAERIMELGCLPKETGTTSGEDTPASDSLANDLSGNSSAISAAASATTSSVNDSLFAHTQPLFSFENVSFTYGRLPVLENVSFTVNAGDFISLEGISGGGKSTLFLLLLDAYRPTSGTITWHKDAQQSEPEQVGSFENSQSAHAPAGLFAYVPQGNALFSGTIRQNVTFFSNEADSTADVASTGLVNSSAQNKLRSERKNKDTAVWQALEIACAADFVRELPGGLDTELSESGHGLSEGQMQRIAIARAVYSGAPVLLLDEATSALDEQTEAQLLQNLATLNSSCVNSPNSNEPKLPPKTILIVTHRPAAKAICNRHFALNDGKLTENK